MATSDDRSLALDGIRGIAAVAVMLFHAGLDLDLPWCVGHGWLAVDVFFVMSGVVVERAYGERLRTGWPALSFARVRCRRLYPLYLVGLALGALLRVLVLVGHGAPVAADALGISIAAGALLIPIVSAGPDQVFPLNGPSWSLFVEALANAAFAVVGRRFGRPCLILVAGAGALIVTASLDGRQLALGGRSPTLWLDIARGAFGFGVGATMGYAVRERRLAWLWRLPMPCVFVGLGAMLLVPRGFRDAGFDPFAVLVLCPAIVALAVASRPCAAMATFCTAAGALSYPLYVVHAPILYAAHRLAPQGPGAWAERTLATTVAAFTALVLACILARSGRVVPAPAMALRVPDAADSLA